MPQTLARPDEMQLQLVTPLIKRVTGSGCIIQKKHWKSWRNSICECQLSTPSTPPQIYSIGSVVIKLKRCGGFRPPDSIQGTIGELAQLLFCLGRSVVKMKSKVLNQDVSKPHWNRSKTLPKINETSVIRC